MDARSIEQADREMTACSRQASTDGALALLIGAVAGVAAFFETRVAFALVAGAVLALWLAVVADVKRRSLLGRLSLDRDAYVIPAVRRRARRLTSRRTRARLSQSIRSLVAHPWREPCVVPERVVAFAADLEEIARELEEIDAEVDPVSTAACLRLLTEGADSPLLNPAVPVEDLRAALIRIRDGIHCESADEWKAGSKPALR